MTWTYEIFEHSHDVVIVGAGGVGSRTALGMAASGLKTTRVTKAFPTRGHTVAAQDGMAAAMIGASTIKIGSRVPIGSAPGGGFGRSLSGTLWRWVFLHRRRAHLSASIRRPDRRLRKKTDQCISAAADWTGQASLPRRPCLRGNAMTLRAEVTGPVASRAGTSMTSKARPPTGVGTLTNLEFTTNAVNLRSPSGMFTNKFNGLPRQSQHFFFAKKKQKTLTWSAVSCLKTQLNEQKFFGSFFQKRMLSSSAPCLGCHTFRTDTYTRRRKH